MKEITTILTAKWKPSAFLAEVEIFQCQKYERIYLKFKSIQREVNYPSIEAKPRILPRSSKGDTTSSFLFEIS